MHLNTRAEWFVKGVGGPKTQHGQLKAVNVVDVIRARIDWTRWPNRRGKSTIEEVDVPRSPDCVGLGEATKITVYLKGSGQRNLSKRPIYLRVDGLDWLLSYAADEHFNQGVKSAAVDEVIVKKANCAAVADLNLEWDAKKSLASRVCVRALEGHDTAFRHI